MSETAIRTETPTKSVTKGSKAAYQPTEAQTKALSLVIGTLEGLTLQERSHVLARLGSMYFGGATPVAPKPTKSAKDAPAKQGKSKSQPPKAAWKAAWESSPEFKEFEAAKGQKLPKEEFLELQERAFKARNRFREEFGWISPQSTAAGENHPAEDAGEAGTSGDA